MARPRGQVNVTIAGDARDLERALSKSSGALSGFGKTALGVFGGNVLTKGLDLAVDGLQSLASFAVDGVAKLDGYGDALARLDSLSANLAKSVDAVDLSRWGVDKGEAADAALAVAKMGKALGLSDAELAKVVPGFGELSAKLASLGDGDPVAQAELLAKAMSGNAKAAKALGVELPKGAKGMAAYQAIVAQLGPQLDQATSGQVSLADVGERWDATLANLQLELAGFLDQLAPVVSQLLDALLPAMRQLVDTVGPALSALFTGLSETFAGFVSDGGAAGVVGIFAKLADVAGAVGGFLLDNVLPALAKVAGAIVKALGPAIDAAVAAFQDWLPVLELVWGFVEATVVPLLVDYVVPFLGKLLELVAKVSGAFARSLAPALRTIADWFGRVLDFIRPLLDGLGQLAKLGGDVVGTIGGILPFGGAPGGAAAAARYGAVGGRSSVGGGLAVVNVYAGVGDPVAIGREVSRVLDAYHRRGG